MRLDKFDPNAVIKHHIINKVRYELSNILPKDSFDVRVVETIHKAADVYVVHVLMNLFGKEQTLKNSETRKSVTYNEVPKTWWDHFKLDCFPNWLLQYFPIEYNKLDSVIVYNNQYYETKICPHLKSDHNDMHIRWILDQ